MGTLKLELPSEDDNYTVKEVKSYEDAEIVIEAVRSLQRRAIPYLDAMLKLKHGHDPAIKNHDGFEEYEVELSEDSYGFQATYEHYYCGDSDKYTVYIPLDDMFDDNWLENAKARIAKQQEEEALERARIARQREEDQNRRDYEQYLKLREKFKR